MTKPPRFHDKPSIAAVAKRAGVSIATVSRVLNGVPGRYSAETGEKVRGAVAELGYRPSGAGRTLRRGESRLVAVLAANLANPAMAAMAASTEVALREAGYVMALCDSHDDPAIQDEYLAEAEAQSASAVVMLAAVRSPRLAAIRGDDERIVFVNRGDPDGAARAMVGIDNVAAGREVAAHLAARGAGTVGVVHGPLSSSATADRLAGFLAAWPGGAAPLVEAGEGDHLALGFAAAGRLLDRAERLDALFCMSDLIAYGAARALRESGLRVPGDVAMVGFDDAPLNDWVAPWLSSVHVPYAAFGAAIVDALDRRAAGEERVSIVLPHTLNTRG